MEYKVEIGGVTYDMGDIQSCTLKRPLFNSFSVGNVCSAELDITFWPSQAPPRMAKIVPYARESDMDDWAQLGVFYTDTREEQDGALNILAYDSMLRGEQVWEPDSSLQFPMTMQEAVKEIAKLMGLNLDGRTMVSGDYTIDYPANDYTLREILGYIAAANAGNWVVTAKDELLLVPLFSYLK